MSLVCLCAHGIFCVPWWQLSKVCDTKQRLPSTLSSMFFEIIQLKPKLELNLFSKELKVVFALCHIL